MDVSSEFTIKNILDLPILEQPERFAEIKELQEVITHREMPNDTIGFERMKLHRNTVIFLAVCKGEKIVGMAQATLIHNLINSKAFVDSVAVHPSLQGKGLGQVVMKALEAEVRKQWPTVAKIILTSSEKRGTRPFYTKLGYVPREAENATLIYELQITS